ncbi:MAG TPA: hypothetical protein VH020_13865 [Stellaceae bacterium]|jgi:hypothetical protein|nr:hypothetical protein [Stellaceae bacterium]
MRVPYFSLLAILGVYLVVAPGFTDARAPAHRAAAAVAALPDPALTPGAVATRDVVRICAPGYARAARHTSEALKVAIYAAYKMAPQTGHYVIDHLIPLELGGADVAANLWPENEQTHGGNARDKDRLENFLHREVCAGRISLRQAQGEIAGNWRAAYRKYLGAR